jgi:hypothetical protein
MPPQTISHPLLMPGSLVQAAYAVRTLSYSEIDGSDGEEPGYLPPGTAGIIIKRPPLDHPRQFLVQFVGGHEGWMYPTEIEPYHKEEENV